MMSAFLAVRMLPCRANTLACTDARTETSLHSLYSHPACLFWIIRASVQSYTP